MKKSITIFFLFFLIIPTLTYSQDLHQNLSESFIRAFVWDFLSAIFLLLFVFSCVNFLLHLASSYINKIAEKFSSIYSANYIRAIYTVTKDFVLIFCLIFSVILVLPGFFGIFTQYFSKFYFAISLTFFIALLSKSYLNVETNPTGFKIYNLLIVSSFIFTIIAVYRIF